MTLSQEYQDTKIKKTQIVNKIRKDWSRSDEKHDAIDRCKKRVVLPNEREKTLIRCAHCQGLFPREGGYIEAHHVIPVGQLESTHPRDVAAYKKRMFCGADGIVPLCLDCHAKQTKEDNKKIKAKNKETA